MSIPLKECLPRHLYRVIARNFDLAVYNGDTGFIGVREKFGNRYLDTEYCDEGYGTVTPMEDLGLIDSIIEKGSMLLLSAYYPYVYCSYCGDILKEKIHTNNKECKSIDGVVMSNATLELFLEDYND